MDFNSPRPSPQPSPPPSPQSRRVKPKPISKIYKETMYNAAYNNSMTAGIITFLVNSGILFDMNGRSDMSKLVYVSLIFAYTLGSYLIAQTWKSNRHGLMPYHAAIYFCLGGSIGMLSLTPFLGQMELEVEQGLKAIGILCLNGLMIFLVVWKVYKPENFQKLQNKVK